MGGLLPRVVWSVVTAVLVVHAVATAHPVAAQRAIGAGLAEGGGAVAATVAADGRGDPVRTGDRVRAEVDVEVGLGEHTARRGGLLGLAPRVDVVVGEVFVELAGAVRVVAVHRRLGRAGRAGPLAARLGG